MERIAGAMGGIAWEVIIVDDDSHDGTADEARALALDDPRVRVIQRIGRRGLASAAIEGFCATPAPYVAVMDADHQHDPRIAARDCWRRSRRGKRKSVSPAGSFPAPAPKTGPRPNASACPPSANGLARRLTGVELTDPMSGYFHA